MRYVIKFPVRGGPQLVESWPLKFEDCFFFLEKNEDKNVTFVGYAFENVPVDQAPLIQESIQNNSVSHVTFRISKTAEVAQKLRVWQSLLSIYILFDIDYDQPTEELKAEHEGEVSKIQVNAFTRHSTPDSGEVKDFAVLARAALAIEDNLALPEKTGFLIEGRLAAYSNKIIDAYNYFYLYIESNFKLKFKTKDAVSSLASNNAFISAINEYLKDKMFIDERIYDKFPGIKSWPGDREALANDIVLLRGRLRHHSIGDSRRWNLLKQEEYRCQAVFLGMICSIVARDTTLDVIFEERYGVKYLEVSRRVGAMISVVSRVFYTEKGLPREIEILINIPSMNVSPDLAKAVL